MVLVVVVVVVVIIHGACVLILGGRILIMTIRSEAGIKEEGHLFSTPNLIPSYLKVRNPHFRS